jgi:hypothetical protein
MLAGEEGPPYVLSALVALTTMDSGAWRELSIVAGLLFAQITQPPLEPQYVQREGLQWLNSHPLRAWTDGEGLPSSGVKHQHPSLLLPRWYRCCSKSTMRME